MFSDYRVIFWTPGCCAVLHWFDHQGERQQRQADCSRSSDWTEGPSNSWARTSSRLIHGCFIFYFEMFLTFNLFLVMWDCWDVISLMNYLFIYVFIQDLVMDILRVLSTPDLEVRKKTLQLALDLVSSRNVEEVGFKWSVIVFQVFLFFWCFFSDRSWTALQILRLLSAF